mmetsp:Transcript_43585/g.131896  ORF Transcript_43585/g.131896 Transcript_43585/m.131896 type:complete len:282 (+) Transcript_43585:256-1101(+)
MVGDVGGGRRALLFVRDGHRADVRPPQKDVAGCLFARGQPVAAYVRGHVRHRPPLVRVGPAPRLHLRGRVVLVLFGFRAADLGRTEGAGHAPRARRLRHPADAGPCRAGSAGAFAHVARYVQDQRCGARHAAGCSPHRDGVVHCLRQRPRGLGLVVQLRRGRGQPGGAPMLVLCFDFRYVLHFRGVRLAQHIGRLPRRRLSRRDSVQAAGRRRDFARPRGLFQLFLHNDGLPRRLAIGVHAPHHGAQYRGHIAVGEIWGNDGGLPRVWHELGQCAAGRLAS